MRSLGNIKLALLCHRYDIEFEYSTPEKIDLFAFHLLDIIAHKNNLITSMKLSEILQEIGIPSDLLNIYEKRLGELAKSSPKFIECVDSSTLGYPVSEYYLTEFGINALQTKELPLQTKKKNISLIYNHYTQQFSLESQVIKADVETSLEINPDIDIEKEELKAMVSKEIEKNIRKYLSEGNEKTKIYNIVVNNDSLYPTVNFIKIIEENNEIKLDNDNKLVLDAFSNLDYQTKKLIKEKMFKYLKLPNLDIDFSKAIICNQDIPKYKNAFINISLKNYDYLNSIFNNHKPFIDSNLEYQFAGLDEKNMPVMFRYCVKDVLGYEIPFLEIDRRDVKYDEIYDRNKKFCISQIISEGIKTNMLEDLLVLTTNKNKMNVLKEIINSSENDYVTTVNTLKDIFSKFKDNINLKKTIQEIAKTIVLDNVEKERLSIENVIEISKQFELPEQDYFSIIKSKFKFDNNLINKMLVMNEQLAITVFELKRLYNEALPEDELSLYKHNTSMFSDFLNYNKQYNEMKSLGFKNYYDYELPKKNWDNFMENVNRLKSLYNRVSQHLTPDNKKGADDFFGTIIDIFYELAPIDINTKGAFENTGNFLKDMEKAINEKNPYFVALAATIRQKYSEILHELELNKEADRKKERFGKELIVFVLNKSDVDEVYSSWRNLCVLVHSDTEKEHTLVKGDDKVKRKALITALNIYRDKLKKLEKKGE